MGKWFNGDYYTRRNSGWVYFNYEDPPTKPSSLANSHTPRSGGNLNRKYLLTEVVSTAKIERKMDKYLADNEEGRRRLAEAKVSCAASANFVNKVMAPREDYDPVERLNKFSCNLVKYNQLQAKKTRTEMLKQGRLNSTESDSPSGVDKMETIFDPFDPSRGLGYRSRTSIWDVSLDRAMELKTLLEQRERYFNGEMDDMYYKISPGGKPLPTPPNIVNIRSSRSTVSSHHDTSVHAIKDSSESSVSAVNSENSIGLIAKMRERRGSTDVILGAQFLAQVSEDEEDSDSERELLNSREQLVFSDSESHDSITSSI